MILERFNYDAVRSVDIIEILDTIVTNHWPSDVRYWIDVYRIWTREMITAMKMGKLENTVDLRGNNIHFLERVMNFMGYFMLSVNVRFFPCTVYKLSTDAIRGSYRDADTATFVDFVKTISPFLTDLTLVSNLDSGILRSLEIENMPEYPFLQTLRVSMQPGKQGSHRMRRLGLKLRPFFCLVESLLEKAPALKTLHFDITPLCAMKLVPLAYGALVVKRNSEHLKDLAIAAPFRNSDWERLLTLGVKLESLRLDFSSNFKNTSGLTPFLLAQSPTLKSLTVSCDSSIHLQMHPLPFLEHFAYVAKEPCVFQKQQLMFPPVPYRSIFPMLKSVSLTTEILLDTSYWNTTIDFGTQSMATVENLTLPNTVTDPTVISKAAQLFPNVKRVGIVANPAMVSAVVSAWPGLEEMMLVTGSELCIDHVLTGLGPETCADLGQQMRTGPRRANILARFSTEVVYTSPLLALHNLKVLRLHRIFRNEPLEISRISIALVLMQMPCLEMVDFGDRDAWCTPDNMIPRNVYQDLASRCQVNWNTLRVSDQLEHP